MYLILAVYRGGLPMRVVCKSINLGALRLGAGFSLNSLSPNGVSSKRHLLEVLYFCVVISFVIIIYL